MIYRSDDDVSFDNDANCDVEATGLVALAAFVIGSLCGWVVKRKFDDGEFDNFLRGSGLSRSISDKEDG